MTDSAEHVHEAPALEVFWRPGCPYCYRLLDTLEEAGVRLSLHNIWEDEAARAIVAGINRGNETVPTVVFGETTATNPDPLTLVEELRAGWPQLFVGGPANDERPVRGPGLRR